MTVEKDVKKPEQTIAGEKPAQDPAMDKKAEVLAKLKAESDAEAAKKLAKPEEHEPEAEKPKANPADVMKLEEDALADKQVETVYGLMVDGSNGHQYDRAPSKVYEDNGWLRMQIAAGKMRIAD